MDVSSSWEDLDVDDSDLPSLIHPSKNLLPCKRPQHQINNKSSSSSSSHQTIPPSFFSLQPCSQNPRFQPSSSSSQPEYINPDTHLSQSLQVQTLHHTQEEGPSTSGQHLIPGPAGKMQAAMNRKVLYNRNNEEKITTQECLRRIQEDEDEDQDFKSNPWLCAMEFHGGSSKGFSGLDGNVAASRYPLKTIKTLRNDRVPWVVAVIDSCTSNGFGDLSVTLKDPTGTIGANIHRKVITESEFGKDISVGSVLILQQVVVFSPSSSTHYLNITLRNIVKVISKNSGPPTKTYNASTDRLAPCGTEERREIRPQPPMVVKSSFLRSREAEVVNAVREKGKKSVDYDIQMEENRPARESFHFTSSNSRYRNASEVESLLMRNKKTDGTRMEAVRRDSCNADLTIILDDNDDHSKEASQSKTISRGSSSAAIEVEEDHCHETGRTKSEAAKPKQQLVSTTSLPEWTDEQLEELFADGW